MFSLPLLCSWSALFVLLPLLCSYSVVKTPALCAARAFFKSSRCLCCAAFGLQAFLLFLNCVLMVLFCLCSAVEGPFLSHCLRCAVLVSRSLFHSASAVQFLFPVYISHCLCCAVHVSFWLMTASAVQSLHRLCCAIYFPNEFSHCLCCAVSPTPLLCG